MNTMTLKIDGMSCDGCAERVTTLLEKEPGIRKVAVSFSTGEGQISFNPQSVAEERIFEIITQAGFGAESF